MMYGCNLGSGQRPFHSTLKIQWLNIDKVQHEGMPKPDILEDCCNLIGVVENESMDYVVAHHIYEHLPMGGNGILEEAYRILKPGGSFIITIPDIKALAQYWMMGKIDDYTMMVNLYGAYQGHEEDRHKWGYTRESLMDSLRARSWSESKPFDWRKIPGSSIVQDWWILGHEAVK